MGRFNKFLSYFLCSSQMKKKKKEIIKEEKKEEMGEGFPWERFPLDLFIEILVRMDVKSLGKCKCACKLLRKTISSPAFINMHLDRSMLRSSNLLLFVGRDFHYQDDEYSRHQRRQPLATFTTTSTNDHDLIEHARGGNYINTSNDFPNFITNTMECYPPSCDLLFFKYKRILLLCNPWTRQFYEIPAIKESCLLKELDVSPLVFGYMACKREYLIVTVTKVMRNEEIVYAAHYICFSRSSNRTGEGGDMISIKDDAWKETADTCPRYVQEGILIHNVIYWLINNCCYYPDTKKLELIISYHIEKQKFEIIDSPATPYWESHPHRQSAFGTSIKLIHLKGSLYLTDEELMQTTQVFQMWTLKSSTTATTTTTTTSNSSWDWVKQYNIKLDFPIGSIASPISSSDGELVIKSSSRGYYLYNPEKNRVKIVSRPPPAISMEEDRFREISVGFFWESWLSFDDKYVWVIPRR